MLKKTILIFSIICYVFNPSFVFAIPKGAAVESGTVTFQSPSANVLDITASNKAIINWQNFDITSGETVNFIEPSVTSVVLNRILGGNASEIAGILNANGLIILINPAGINFASTAQINVAGLIASSLNIGSNDFLAGRYNFARGNEPVGMIINQGKILAAQDGFLLLLGGAVSNTGTMTAKLGTIAMASGDQATVTVTNNQLLSVVVDQATMAQITNVKDAVKNTGTLSAPGGTVLLTAKTLSNIFDNAINQAGMIDATSVSEKNGKVILSANGPVIDTGTIDASGKNAGETGGDVEILGSEVGLFDNALINASGAAGGGSIHIGRDPSTGLESQETIIDPNVTLNASATQNGNGGFIETSGDYLMEGSANISTAGAAGGKTGEWLLDPYNVTISSGATSGGFFNGDTLAPDAFIPTATSIVSSSDIVSVLNAGTSVNITTAGGGSDSGNITVSSAIDTDISTGTPTLTLNAAGSIVLNAGISDASGSALNLNLTSGTGATFNAPVNIQGTLTAGATTGNITQDSSGSITTAITNLTASAGYIDVSEANNSFGTINATAGGANAGVGINLNDTNASGLILGTLDSGADNGNITVTANSLDLGQNGGAYLNAGTGMVTLTATTGSVTDDSNNNETISAGSAFLTADASGQGINLTGNNYFGVISAVSDSGGIFLNDINPNGIVVDNLDSSSGNGPIDVVETAGDINLGTSQGIINAGQGHIFLEATTGSITDYGSPLFEEIQTTGSGSIQLFANNNIELVGSNQFNILDAQVITGNINVNDVNTSGGLTLNRIINDSGNISITTQGPLNLYLNNLSQLESPGTIALTGDTISDNGSVGDTSAATLNLIATDSTTPTINLAHTDLSNLSNLGISLPNVSSSPLSFVTFDTSAGLGSLVGLTFNTPDSNLSVSDLASFLATNSITPSNITLFGLTSDNVTDADIPTALTEFTNLSTLSLGNSTNAAFNLTDNSFAASLSTLNIYSAGSIDINPTGGTLSFSSGTLNLTAQASSSPITVEGIIDVSGLGIEVPNAAYNVSDITGYVIDTDLTSLSLTSQSVGTGDISSALSDFTNLSNLTLANTNNQNMTITSGVNFNGNLSITTGGAVDTTAASIVTTFGNISLSGSSLNLGSVTAGGNLNLTATAGDIASTNLQVAGRTTLNASGNINLDNGSNTFDLGGGTVSATAGGNVDLTNNESNSSAGTLVMGNVNASGTVTIHELGANNSDAGNLSLGGTVNAGGNVNLESQFGNIQNSANINLANGATLDITGYGAEGNATGFINTGTISGNSFILNFNAEEGAGFGFTFDNSGGTIGNGVDPFTLNIYAPNEDNSGSNVAIALGTLSAGPTVNNKGFTLSVDTPNMDMTIDALENSYSLSASSNIQSLSITSDNTSGTDIVNALSGPDQLVSLTTLSLTNTTGSDFDLTGGQGSIDLSQLTGALFLETNGGNIIQTGNVSAAPGSLEMIANSIDLTTAGNHLGTVSVLTIGNVTLNDDGNLVLGSITVGGNLDITTDSALSLTQIGSVGVSVTSSINTSSSGNITLNNSGNDFSNQTVTLTGENISLQDSDASGLILGDVVANGNLDVTAASNISQAGSDTIDMTSGTAGANTASFNIASGGTGSVNLDNNNDFNQNPVNVGGAGTVGAVTINDVDTGGLVLGAINTSGNVSIISDATLSFTGASPSVTLTGGASNKTVTLVANQFDNTNSGTDSPIDLGSGTDNVWHFYLTNLSGNTFSSGFNTLDSSNQAIWNTSYPTAISESGNRYIFATSETLTLLPAISLLAITKTQGELTTLPTPSSANYQLSGFVNASLYGNVFIQDTINNTPISGISFTSGGTSVLAAVGSYPVSMTGTASGFDGYDVTYNPAAEFGHITINAPTDNALYSTTEISQDTVNNMYGFWIDNEKKKHLKGKPLPDNVLQLPQASFSFNILNPAEFQAKIENNENEVDQAFQQILHTIAK